MVAAGDDAARDGEQTAVVKKLLYFSPRFASRSYVCTGIAPPKGSVAPKPTSSVITSKTLGAPFGADTSTGHLIGSESLIAGATLPTF